MSDNDRCVRATRVIRAPASAIFDLLADPRRHGDFDGSGTVRSSVSGPDRLELGSRFGMSMRMGLPYRVTNVVVELEPDRRIAWRHFGRHRWRYELEPTEGGTTVTETFDWSTVPRGLDLLARARSSGNQRAMQATLERLAALVETS